MVALACAIFLSSPLMCICHIRRLPLWGTVVTLLLFAFSAQAKDAPSLDVMTVCESKLGPVADTMVSLGDLRITFDQHVFWKGQEVFLLNGQYVQLEPKHNDYFYRVLLALIDHPNEPQSFDELYDDAWVDKSSDHDGVEQSVRHAVIWIRRAFHMVDPDFDQIRTIRHDGYYWQAGESHPDLQTPDLTVISALRKVFWKGQEVKLTKSQFGMFWLMLQLQDDRVSYDKLFRAYSGSVLLLKSQTEMVRILAVGVDNIRKAFKAVDPGFNRIESVRKIGYGWRSSEDVSVNDRYYSGSTIPYDLISSGHPK